MFAQSSDSVNTDDIGEFLDDSIKGKNILVGYNIALSFGVFLHLIKFTHPTLIFFPKVGCICGSRMKHAVMLTV